MPNQENATTTGGETRCKHCGGKGICNRGLYDTDNPFAPDWQMSCRECLAAAGVDYDDVKTNSYVEDRTAPCAVCGGTGTVSSDRD